MLIDSDMVKKNIVGQVGRAGADFSGITRRCNGAIFDCHIMRRSSGALIRVAIRLEANRVIAGFNVQIFEGYITPTKINAVRILTYCRFRIADSDPIYRQIIALNIVLRPLITILKQNPADIYILTIPDHNYSIRTTVAN